MKTEDNASYVLGHTDRELARLERQAAFFEQATRDVLVRAGIAPGMRVLDLGCGVGDVSAIAADLVGRNGEVVGIDMSPEALAIAEKRMRATGRPQVRFQAVAIEAFEGYGDFDAVIGRFILVHIPDPSALLRVLAGRLRAGTLLAFMEMDMSTGAALPPLPLLERCIGWILEVYRRAGRQSDMGSRLHATFRSSGLDPELAGFTRIASGAEQAGFEFLTESVRSLMPVMGKLGIASADEIGIDTLRDRLLAEAGPDHCVFYPRLVGAWARTAA